MAHAYTTRVRSSVAGPLRQHALSWRAVTTGPLQAILAAPMGVVRLMDTIADGREAIRNEVLLLLVGLTRSSPDIQKIAAFEGAFDRLLSIVL